MHLLIYLKIPENKTSSIFKIRIKIASGKYRKRKNKSWILNIIRKKSSCKRSEILNPSDTSKKYHYLKSDLKNEEHLKNGH